MSNQRMLHRQLAAATQEIEDRLMILSEMVERLPMFDVWPKGHPGRDRMHDAMKQMTAAVQSHKTGELPPARYARELAGAAHMLFRHWAHLKADGYKLPVSENLAAYLHNPSDDPARFHYEVFQLALDPIWTKAAHEREVVYTLLHRTANVCDAALNLNRQKNDATGWQHLN